MKRVHDDIPSHCTPLVCSMESRTANNAPGCQHSLVLLSNGDLLSFGFGQYGQLEHGDWDHRYTPTGIPTLSGAVAVAAGQHHSLVLRRSWGG